jgi:hypothetical protein
MSLTTTRHFFEAVSLFDWVTPTLITLKGVGRNPFEMWHFTVDLDGAVKQGFDQGKINKLLAQSGLATESRITQPFGRFSFACSIYDARDIERLLGRHHIALKGGRFAPKKRRRQRRRQKVHNICGMAIPFPI